LLAKQFDQAESEADIEEIIRKDGDLKLWQRVHATGTVSCLGDGNHATFNTYIV